MSTETEVLRRAREIISDPTKWTQGTYARDKYGHRAEPDSPAASRWDALGAITRASKELGVREGIGAGSVDRLITIAKGPVSTINDNQGHAAVLALFDKALSSEMAA